ncbi:rsbT co-antagonist protein RsbR [Azospirillaceae bacterium]
MVNTDGIDCVVRTTREQAFSSWFKIAETYDFERATGPGGEVALQRQTSEIYRSLIEVFSSSAYDDLEREEFKTLLAAVRGMAEWRARKSFSVGDIVDYLIALKSALNELIKTHYFDNSVLFSRETIRVQSVLDRLLRNGVEAFVAARDEIIGRQSRAILEISTPVIKVWDDILLLPLVGVIDTARAQQLIERLLEAISRFEARVAILDITGVPVIDSRVARHLLVTINATRMLGADTIVTGISPDAAITLTGLGIDLARVNTKGTLRAGMNEAFRLIGKMVIACP